MKIQILSDTHIDHYGVGPANFFSQKINWMCDVLVIAGDVSSFRFLKQAIEYLANGQFQIIFVAGNHEFYGKSFEEVEDTLRDLESKHLNFHWLNNNHVTISNQRFIGGTLWFEKSKESTDKYIKRYLSDFSYIKNFEPEVFERFEASKKFLEEKIQQDDIIVTHHMPSYKCIDEKYKYSLLNCYFANNLDYIIKKKCPKIWIYGHTHAAQDFFIDKTRMLCNPYGYPHEKSRADKFVVKI